MSEVSVVIPTYEEHETIAGVLARVDDELSAHAHEVLVVDDSPDEGTERAVRSVADRLPVKYISGPGEGLAAAVIGGLRAAEHDRIVVMDGDGQHPASAVPLLVDALETADVAVGSRHVGGRITADWSAARYAMSFGASALAWAAVPDARVLQDPMSGMFGVRWETVAAVLDDLRPVGYKILLELLARAPVGHVAEVPVEFRARKAGESKTDLREMVRYSRHMARLAVASRRRSHPLRTVSEGAV